MPRKPLRGERAEVAALGGMIAERAWQSTGVRVYVLPCRSIIVIRVGSRADGIMLRARHRYLVATWCRDAQGRGPNCIDVVAELRHALRCARGAA